MKYIFPGSTSRKLYENYRTHTAGGERVEINMPLCMDDKDRINLGTTIVKGEHTRVETVPEDTCGKDKKIGDIHTHPYAPHHDIEFFKEVEMHSQADLLGAMSNILMKNIKQPFMSCVFEPRLVTDNSEHYFVLCEKYNDIVDDDIREARRVAKPDINRVKQDSFLQGPTFMIAMEDYPWGEKLPESILKGLKTRKIPDKLIEKYKLKDIYGESVLADGKGLIYPPPEAQDSLDLEDWIKLSKKPRADHATIQHAAAEVQKPLFWMKADAASIKQELHKKGKLTVDGFPIVCRKVPFGRGKQTRTICDFKDEVLDL